MPYDASLVYARNIWALVDHVVTDGALTIDLEDEVTAGCTLTHAGDVQHGPTREALGMGAKEIEPDEEDEAESEDDEEES